MADKSEFGPSHPIPELQITTYEQFKIKATILCTALAKLEEQGFAQSEPTAKIACELMSLLDEHPEFAQIFLIESEIT